MQNKKVNLEKLISNNTLYSRKEASKLILENKVEVNEVIFNKKENIDYKIDTIKINGQEIFKDEFVYLVMHKPKDYICANKDMQNKVVFDLLDQKYRYIKNLHTVGRLDKDTTGLLLITNDGDFSHNLLSPKKHVLKDYLVTLENKLSNDLIDIFASGIDIGERKITKPAKLVILNDYQAILTINEGKFHQVKRMFEKVGNRVLDLHRIGFGNLKIDNMSLQSSQYRELTNDELMLIKQS